MTDDRIDQRLRELARDYHRPPAVPREALWARIAAERARRRAAPRVLALRPWLRRGLAAAAVLVLGIALGRLTAPATQLATPADTTGTVAYRVAAAQYLTRTEALLASFRAEARSGRLDAQFGAQARDLLTTTRLMMDSPAARDPRLKSRAAGEIAQVPAGRAGEEVDLITQGIEQRSVLLRLQTAVPAGPGARAQGAL